VGSCCFVGGGDGGFAQVDSGNGGFARVESGDAPLATLAARAPRKRGSSRCTPHRSTRLCHWTSGVQCVGDVGVSSDADKTISHSGSQSPSAKGVPADVCLAGARAFAIGHPVSVAVGKNDGG